MAGEDPLDEPLARLVAAHEARVRQIARKLGPIGAVELRRQVDRAGGAGRCHVGAVRVAAQMRVGERERRDSQCVAGIALALPLHQAVQEVERDARLGKHARQVELALACGEDHARA